MMNFQELVNELETAGFYDAVPKETRVAVKQEILRTKFLYPDAVSRSFSADAEDLAERGALEFIAEVAPRLAKHGVHIPVIAFKLKPRNTRDPATGEINEVIPTVLRVDDSIPDPAGITHLRPATEDLPDSGDYYRITIGSRTQEIWNTEMAPEKMWEAGMCHTFLLVNQLLEAAHAAERLYGLYGGNDGLAVFLTPDQFDLIHNCPDIQASEKPWAPYKVS